LLDPTAVKQALALRLRQLRREKGWSQEVLAEGADMHRTYLAGIERALRNPSLENLVKLSNAVGISLAELFTFAESGSSDLARSAAKEKKKPHTPMKRRASSTIRKEPGNWV
jgi:transcriptional regulator with XRE-family HTH domain